MEKPIIADNKPKAVELEKGTAYSFCVCGRSNNQPFCDGSHHGSQLRPKSFIADKSGTAYLCQCKHTANAPFCDGSHKQFSAEQVIQSRSKDKG
jgi:methylamine---glutamate N-methyltransferase subunit C